MFLDSQSAGITLWENSDTGIASEIKNIREFLLSEERFDRSPSPIPGWRPLGNFNKQQVAIPEGLTLQVAATLLRSSIQLHESLSQDLLSSIPSLLDKVAEWSPDRQPDTGSYEGIPFTNHLDITRSERINITYLWYPWAIETATRYLEYSRIFKQPTSHLFQIRRALGILVVDHGDASVKIAETKYTFYVSELLYCLSSPWFLGK